MGFITEKWSFTARFDLTLNVIQVILIPQRAETRRIKLTVYEACYKLLVTKCPVEFILCMEV